MKQRAGGGVGVRGVPRVRGLWVWTPLAGVALLLVLLLSLEGPTPLRRQACWAFLWNYDEALDVADDFEGFDNVSGAFSSKLSAPALLVPNVVHFLRMGQREFTFLEYVCVLAAWQQQQPDWIMFHTDLADFGGEYWMRLQATPGLREVIQLVPTQALTHVFGQPLDRLYGKWHAGDILRIGILQKYGGIFLDNDSYLLTDLNLLRRYEMSLGWPKGAFIGTQVLLAHPHARFLRVWLECYRDAYRGTLWYYNAGQRPSQLALHARPELVHRMPVRLGVDMDVKTILYLRRDLEGWRGGPNGPGAMFAVHLFERHTGSLAQDGERLGLRYPVRFTEKNICNYNVTILQMAQAVLPRLCRHQ